MGIMHPQDGEYHKGFSILCEQEKIMIDSID